jgi:hypothetical protein
VFKVHTFVFEVHTLVFEVHTFVFEVHTLVFEVHNHEETKVTELHILLPSESCINCFLSVFVFVEARKDFLLVCD